MVLKPYSMVIVASKPRQWFSKLVASLGQPISIRPPLDFLEDLETEIPDAILSTEQNGQMRELFHLLHESFTPLERPAIILFLVDPPDEELEQLADAILPKMDSGLLGYQIIRAIDDKQTRAAFEQEILDLREEQAIRQRAIHEISILKKAIVRNVSHELGTPLLQVKSAVAMMAEDMSGSNLSEYAIRATARLEAVVKNITQLAASLNEPQMSPLIIRECLDSALRDLRRTWEHTQHMSRIRVHIEDHLPPAYGDRNGIKIVMQELIDNALKFSADAVDVSAHLEDDCILIAVQDSGIGIDPDELDEIFVEFYQIDPSDTRPYGGTGVGLANVRLILDRHRAPIVVDSEIDGGSTFSFALPLADLENAL